MVRGVAPIPPLTFLSPLPYASGATGPRVVEVPLSTAIKSLAAALAGHIAGGAVVGRKNSSEDGMGEEGKQGGEGEGEEVVVGGACSAAAAAASDASQGPHCPACVFAAFLVERAELAVHNSHTSSSVCTACRVGRDRTGSPAATNPTRADDVAYSGAASGIGGRSRLKLRKVSGEDCFRGSHANGAGGAGCGDEGVEGGDAGGVEQGRRGRGMDFQALEWGAEQG
ncbi:unnamed protein product [Closterium sp. NIES-65]|nr:unnamed protein product [Closterium sp. NIES-65]